jgi:Cupin domain
MRIAKNDIPVKLDAPGAKARQSADFGTADGVLSAEYFSLGAGTDIAPLLQGLEGDLCQAPHWGYVLEGEIVVTYADGAEETCHRGDLYYWPAGHTVRVVDDAELVMFSPRAAHGHVIDHLAAKIAAQG